MKTGTLAGRTVSGVMAAMVTATAAATAVGFWLSYNGLHEFAVRAGLSGAEAWAWPASVDLFIVAGEAGVTISALRRERDWGAWAYLALGFAASVTGNILHVHPGQLPWAPYAVAAVPPMAAMAALAALLRIVYRLATERAAEADTVSAREADTERTPKRTQRPANVRTARRPMSTKEKALKALIDQPDMSAEDLASRYGVTARQGRRYRKEAAEMATTANGHAASP